MRPSPCSSASSAGVRSTLVSIGVVVGDDRQPGLGDLAVVLDHGALVGAVGVRREQHARTRRRPRAACSAQRRASAAPYAATPGMTTAPVGAPRPPSARPRARSSGVSVWYSPSEPLGTTPSQPFATSQRDVLGVGVEVAAEVPPGPVGRIGSAVATRTPRQGRRWEQSWRMPLRVTGHAVVPRHVGRGRGRRAGTGTATAPGRRRRADRRRGRGLAGADRSERATASPAHPALAPAHPGAGQELHRPGVGRAELGDGPSTAPAGTSSHRQTTVSSRQPAGPAGGRTGCAPCMRGREGREPGPARGDGGVRGGGSRPAATAAAAVPATAPPARARSAPPTPVSSPAA